MNKSVILEQSRVTLFFYVHLNNKTHQILQKRDLVGFIKVCH